MKATIVIPTCKSRISISPLICELEGFTSFPIIATCQDASAPINRNYGLDRVKTPYVIMIDDDISGFFDGWDKLLLEPLERDVVMVSARLMKPEGGMGEMVGGNYDDSKDIVYASHRHLPSAVIAIKKEELRFNEDYRGGGFEDTDYCYQLREKYFNCKFAICNKCKLIHKNEQKRQIDNFGHNSKTFHKKWQSAL